MYVLVLAVHIVVSVFLILVVLLQSGKSGDLASAFGGGAGTQTVFGPRGSATVLSKATRYSAIAFMVTSLALVWLSQQRGGGSVVEDSAPPAQQVPAVQPGAPPAQQPGTPQPAAPQGTQPQQPAGTPPQPTSPAP
ncbi:MAG: preprotein translocase subunit SecG [Acidobacteria bacterium]|nr:preprotein translocase subunit SecG [Acidobacteriota bacterium]